MRAEGAPLGLLTNAVQILAGILLPSASVFLLPYNDKEVLGLTAIVCGIPEFMLLILTAPIVYREIRGNSDGRIRA